MSKPPKEKTPLPDIKVLGKKEARKPTNPPQEIGGQKGPEPTRYGDWEKGGRCSDF